MKKKRNSEVGVGIIPFILEIDRSGLTRTLGNKSFVSSSARFKIGVVLCTHPNIIVEQVRLREKYRKQKFQYPLYEYDDNGEVIGKLKLPHLDAVKLLDENLKSIYKDTFLNLYRESVSYLHSIKLDPIYWSYPFISSLTYGVLPLLIDTESVTFVSRKVDQFGELGKVAGAMLYPHILIRNKITEKSLTTYIHKHWKEIEKGIDNLNPTYLEGVDINDFAIGAWAYRERLSGKSWDEIESRLEFFSSFVDKVSTDKSSKILDSNKLLSYERTVLVKLISASKYYLSQFTPIDISK